MFVILDWRELKQIRQKNSQLSICKTAKNNKQATWQRWEDLFVRRRKEISFRNVFNNAEQMPSKNKSRQNSALRDYFRTLVHTADLTKTE